MSAEMQSILITAVIATTVGLIGGALWNLLRSTIVKRVKVSSPESRDIKRLDEAVTDQRFLLESMADRQVAQSQSVIILANAVKNDRPEQADAAIEMLTLSERRYMVQLQERLIHSQSGIPDAESAS